MTMRLVEVEEIPNLENRYKYDKLIDEFVKSGKGICKIEDTDKKKPASISISLKQALRRKGYLPRIWCLIRGKEIYIINSSRCGLRYTKCTRKVYLKKIKVSK